MLDRFAVFAMLLARLRSHDDELVGEPTDQVQLQRPQVVGVDLIAAQRKLVRALRSFGKVVSLVHEIVDQRHGVVVLADRPPARAIESTLPEKLGA